MKSFAVAGGVGALVLATIVPAAAQTTTPREGATCRTAGAKSTGRTTAGTNALLTCTKVGTKLTWKAATPVTTSAPVATAAPVVSVAAAPAKSEKWPEKLIFAPVPAENASAAVANWGPFVKALEAELSKTQPIKIDQISTTSYAGVTEALIAGKVDLAMYGPFSYHVSKSTGAKVDAVAVLVSAIGRAPTYQSFLFTKSTRTDINSVADVRGKKVCFVDPQSTSGYLYPFLSLTDAGIDPVKDVTPIFAGGHDRSAIAVDNGTCDVGFAFDNMVEKVGTSPAQIVLAGRVREGALKVILRSKPIPESPIAVRTDLPDSLVAKIRQVLPTIDALYLQANKFCPTTDAGCGIGSVISGRAPAAAAGNTWIPVTDTFYKDIADGCARTVAPSACKPA